MKHLLWWVLFLPFAAGAQKIRTQVDKLTGDTAVFTRFVYLGTSNSLSEESFAFSFQKEGGKSLLRLSLYLREPLPTIRQGAELHFKLAGGKILTLRSKDTYPGKPRDSDISKGAYIHPAYELDEAAIAALRTSPVYLVRVHYDATHKDYELYPSSIAEMQKAVQALFR